MRTEYSMYAVESRLFTEHNSLAVLRFQATIVGMGWWYAQGKVHVLHSEARLSWCCAKRHNQSLSQHLKFFKCLIWN